MYRLYSVEDLCLFCSIEREREREREKEKECMKSFTSDVDPYDGTTSVSLSLSQMWLAHRGVPVYSQSQWYSWRYGQAELT